MLNVVILCLKIERLIHYIRILRLLQAQEKKKTTKFASRSGYQKYFRPEVKKLLKSLIGLDIVSVTMSLKKLNRTYICCC